MTKITQPTSQASKQLLSDKSLLLTSYAVYPSWVAGNCSPYAPGRYLHGVLVHSWRLPRFLLLTVHVELEGLGQLWSLGRFLFPPHLVGSVFISVLCPRGEQV